MSLLYTCRAVTFSDWSVLRHGRFVVAACLLSTMLGTTGVVWAADSYTMQFPSDRSLGSLHVGSQELPARGSVRVQSGEMVQLHISESGVSDLSPLRNIGPNDIQYISMSGTAADDEDLSHIAHMTGLTTLILKRTAITDAGLIHLRNLTELRYLDLNSLRVSDAGMHHLAGLTKLTRFVGNRTQLGDGVMPLLYNNPDLHTLDMWMTNITDIGMQYLADHERLTRLGLEDVEITDAGLQYLAGLPNLTSINLENNNITDAGLVFLAQIPRLHQLTLEDTFVTDAGIALLADLPLTELALPISVSPAGIELLAHTAAYSRTLQDRQNTYPLAVRILADESGTPIGDANLALNLAKLAEGQEETDRVYFLRTDSAGYAKAYVPPGTPGVTVRAYKDGYISGRGAWDAPLNETFELTMMHGIQIGGSVVDADGAPIGGVRVSLPIVGQVNWNSTKSTPHYVTTDTSGAWVAHCSPDELVSMSVTLDHPEYTTVAYRAPFLTTDKLLDKSSVLTLRENTPLAGRVVNESGDPVAYAEVAEYETWDAGRTRMTLRKATTDTNGDFEWANPPRGTLRLVVSAIGYEAKRHEFNVTLGTESIEIELKRESSSD